MLQKKLRKETVDRICNVLEDLKRTIAMYQIQDYQIYAGSTFDSSGESFVSRQNR